MIKANNLKTNELQYAEISKLKKNNQDKIGMQNV